MVETTEALLGICDRRRELSAQLTSMSTLLVHMLSMIGNMKSEQGNHLRALFGSGDCNESADLSEVRIHRWANIKRILLLFQGWEERVEAALSDFLGPDADCHTPGTRFSDGKLSMASDAAVLRDLVNRLIDSIRTRRESMTGKTAATSSGSPPPAASANKSLIVHPMTEIIHEEEEDVEEEALEEVLKH